MSVVEDPVAPPLAAALLPAELSLLDEPLLVDVDSAAVVACPGPVVTPGAAKPVDEASKVLHATSPTQKTITVKRGVTIGPRAYREVV